jgi:hypothetical protein
LFKWLQQLGIRRPAAHEPGRRPVVRARYDAAQTAHENRRHWATADHLSANAAISPDVRRVLRSRARYEVANNSYAKGIVLTLANYVVATGPRLQMLTGDPAINRYFRHAHRRESSTRERGEMLTRKEERHLPSLPPSGSLTSSQRLGSFSCHQARLQIDK